MSRSDSESGRGRSFLPAFAQAKRRQQRLEELRAELLQQDAQRRRYAVYALLSLLWLESGAEQLATASALLLEVPPLPAAEASPTARRLCERWNLLRSADPAAPPPAEDSVMQGWIGGTVKAVLGESLNVCHAAVQKRPADAAALRQEMEISRNVLQLAQRLRLPQTVEPCMRILRFFTADFGQRTGVMARQTTLIREAACQLLAALPSEELTLFWNALGGADANARRDLLTGVDYIRDERAVPYLAELLRKRFSFGGADRELVGWTLVRAFAHIGSREALPALREIIESDQRPDERGEVAVSPQLAHEARRVIQAIEDKQASKDRHILLRPAMPDPGYLLRPALQPELDNERQRQELLRAGENPNPPDFDTEGS